MKLVFSLATVLFVAVDGDIAWSSVSFSPRLPASTCQPTQITLTLEIDGGIFSGDFVYFYLAGFTSGNCDNKKGNNRDIEEMLLWPRGGWEAAWFEGTVANEYEDSYLRLRARDLDRSPGYRHTILIDPSNDLRPNCGMDANSSKHRISAIAVNDSAAAALRRLNASDAVEGSCYLTGTSLNFRPAIPKYTSTVRIKFISAQALQSHDQVVVKLSGFTSGKAGGVPGMDMAIAIQDGETMAGNTSKYFRGAHWREGCCYQQHSPGYENSTATFYVRDGVVINAGSEVDVVITIGQIRPQCGLPGPYESMTITVVPHVDNSTSSQEGLRRVVPPQAFASANAIGDGCRSLNFCSNNGECDHCLGRCNCEFGFGASEEQPRRRLDEWTCGEPTCPLGATWAGMVTVSGDNAHGTLSECSGAGECKRKSGTCKCFTGFAGPACERRQCPGYSAETGDCSGHGVCASMRDLAMMDQALPLSPSHSSSYDFFTAAAAERAQAWDAKRLYGCVCDSSWPVGLGEGERDKPEWFGPDCSLRRCPSGNDPLTAIDETDCSNRTTASGVDFFRNGSICHVECSNRGVCDHVMGACSCFAGFRGPHCGIVDVLALGAQLTSGGGGGEDG